MVRIAERDAANDAAVSSQIEMAADQAGVARERRLRNRAEPERLRGQHEVRDIGAAIDRTVDAERLVGVDDGHMRRAEEIVVLQRLLGIGRLVSARDAERVVELEAALAAAFEIGAEIFPRRREIIVVAEPARCFCVNQLAETLLGLAAGDDDLPGLAVAPGRRALRGGQHVLDRRAIDFLGQEGAHRVALVEQLFEHADAVVMIDCSVHCLSSLSCPGRDAARSDAALRRGPLWPVCYGSWSRLALRASGTRDVNALLSESCCTARPCPRGCRPAI